MKLFKIIKLLSIFLFFNSFLFSQSAKTTVRDGFWSDSLTWDLGVPQSGDNIVINHYLEIDIKDTVNNILVNENATIYDTLWIKGILNLESDISGGVICFINNNIDKGRLGKTSRGELLSEVVWQKWIERCHGWGMYGGPFEIPMIEYGFLHTGITGGPVPGFWINTYLYDETIPDTNKEIGWTPPSNVNNILPRNQGIYLFDSSTISITESRIIEVNGFVDLEEDFDYKINYTGINSSDDNGWNLISNPFLGTINWDVEGWKKTKIENAIWVLDNCTNLYSSYVNGVGVNGGSPLISSGQAFWVKGIKNNAKLKSKRNVIVDDITEIKSNRSNKIIRLKLNNDEIALVINSNATSTKDTLYDAVKFLTPSSTIYSKVDQKYSINSFDNINNIPIWIRGEGVLEIDLSEYDTIANFVLEDIVNNCRIQISNSTDYYFINTSPEFIHRFNIIFDNVNSVNEINYKKEFEINYIDALGRKTNKEHKGINTLNHSW